MFVADFPTSLDVMNKEPPGERVIFENNQEEEEEEQGPFVDFDPVEEADSVVEQINAQEQNWMDKEENNFMATENEQPSLFIGPQNEWRKR